MPVQRWVLWPGRRRRRMPCVYGWLLLPTWQFRQPVGYVSYLRQLTRSGHVAGHVQLYRRILRQGNSSTLVTFEW